jgi:hypothetical protein
MNDKRKKYLEQAPNSNEMFVAQTILHEFSDAEIGNLCALFSKLEKDVMYKSWAKEMTFAQILHSVRIIESLK